MPLNTLPDFIRSNISLTGVSADFLDGADSSTISYGLRANRNINGGGTITYDINGNLFWSTRFIVIANGNSSAINRDSPDGYFNIDCPTSGTITGVGGASNSSATASGINIPGWHALYYILPVTPAGAASNSANFRLVTYTTPLDIPHNWVLIAIRNGDNNYLYLNNGIVLTPGQSNFAGFSGNLFVGSSNTENYIAFRGTTGDNPGAFDHGYIGERIYGGAEQSELLLFKGNDNDLAAGLDRIRLLAAGHRFDTYSSALYGPFSTVGAAASTTRMFIDSAGVSLPRLNFSGGTSTISALTLADGTVSFESTAGQLFSISNSLTGTIFAVNDISGLPSLEITDLGIIKNNELYGQTVIGSGTPVTNAMLSSVARTSTSIPLVVRGATSQTGNLQEWQDSTGSILGGIAANGDTVFAAKLLGFRYGRFGSDTAFTDQTAFRVTAYTTSLPVIQIKALASQTGDLQQWQNSAGTVLAKIKSGGDMLVPTIQDTTSAGPYLQFGANEIYVLNTATNKTNFIIRAFASQTNDMMQWHSSGGTVLSKVGAAGNFVIGGSSTLAQLSVYTGAAATIGLAVRGAASQTANLQEWQDSGGTVLASINSAGSLSISGNGTQISVASSADNARIVYVRGLTNGLRLGTSASGAMVEGVDSTNGVTSLQPLRVGGSTLSLETNGNSRLSIDASGAITIPGALTVTGDLTINGTTTNINTTNLVVEDKNIVLGDVTTPSNTTADGGGITLKGATDKTFNWVNSTGAWTSSEPIIAPAFIPTSSTAPTNGMYLSAANTLNFATNSTNRLSIDSAGAISATSSITTGGALNLNYASPTIASNNASAASIFTSTVTGITIGSSSIKTTAYPADGTTSTAAAGEGYMGMPQVAVTSGGRTIAASDAGKHIFVSTTNSQTITIPANGTVALPIGTTVVIVNDNGISCSIAINTDTLRLANSTSTGTRTLASNGMCTLLKIASTVWIASGNGLT